MPAVAAGAAIVGAGIAIYGDISSANDQNDLDQAKAQVARQQAAEINDRNLANAALLNQQAVRQKLQFGASYAASGKAGVGIGSQLQIQNQANIQNMVATREAEFQEAMLFQQAGIDTTMGGYAETGGTASAVGAGVSGVGSAAKLGTSGGSNPGYGGTQSMGSYPSAESNYGAAPLQMPTLGAGAYGG